MASLIPVGLIATDVEHTGGPFPQLISIGVAHASAGDPMNISKKRIYLNLHKPDAMTWKAFWELKDWDMDTYNWWEKDGKLRLLDHFQSQSINPDPENIIFVQSDKALARELNEALRKAEETYTNTQIVGDAPLVEPFLLGHLLSSNGYHHLGYTRAGAYRSGICTESWQHGLLDIEKPPFEAGWADFSDAQKTQLEPLRYTRTAYTHDPADDAATMLEFTFAAARLQRERWIQKNKE
jgi:hypothetical protein